MTTTTTSKQEAIELLIDAQEAMREAYDKLIEYDLLTNDGHTKAYITDHLRIMIDNQHSFLTLDTNLEQVIEQWETGEME